MSLSWWPGKDEEEERSGFARWLLEGPGAPDGESYGESGGGALGPLIFLSMLLSAPFFKVAPWAFVVVLPCVLLATYGFWTIAKREAKQREERAHTPRSQLRSLALHLTRGTFEVDARSGDAVVRGLVRGREVSLVAPPAALGREGKGEVVRLVAPVAATFDVRIEPNPVTGELTARVTSGRSVADAERRLRAEVVVRDLGVLFARHDVERIELREGELVATARLWTAIPDRLERALIRLASIARALERAQDALSPVVVERPTAAGARCPFCRDPLAAARAVVACARCQTRLHAACWRELGRCTATGCTCERAVPATSEDAGFSLGPLPCSACGLRDQGCSPGACRSPSRRARGRERS